MTGSRKIDLALLIAFLMIVLGTSPWLRVYHRITAFRMTLTRVEAGGGREVIALPPELKLQSYWNREPQRLLPLVENSFRRFAARAEQESGESQTRYELTLDYSFNSPDMDESVTWSAP